MSMEEPTQIGSPVLLADHQRITKRPQLLARIAGSLSSLAGEVARDRMAAGPAYGAITVLFTDAGPQVSAVGALKWDDVTALHHVATDWRVHHGEDLNESLLESHRRRLKLRAMQAQRRAEAKDEKPWICEHCDKRFRTERGANQHERDCWRNPDARRYRSGTHKPTISDGRVVGFSLNMGDSTPSNVAPGAQS